MDEIQADKKLDLLRNQCKVLLGNFDSVQIFCTKTDAEQEETSTFAYGLGNWHSRYGQVREWIIKQEKEIK